MGLLKSGEISMLFRCGFQPPVLECTLQPFLRLILITFAVFLFWLPVVALLTSHYISPSVRLCRIPRCSSERSWQAGQCHSSYWTGVLVVVATKLHKGISMVTWGVSAFAALKHTLLVIGFYWICSFLALWCPAESAEWILKILACSWNHACTF